MKFSSRNNNALLLASMAWGLIMTGWALLFFWAIQVADKSVLSFDPTIAIFFLFFIIATSISYAGVKQIAKGNDLFDKCNEILSYNIEIGLHDKKIFYAIGEKQVELAKRHYWPVSCIVVSVETDQEQDPDIFKVKTLIKEVVSQELSSMIRGSDLIASFAKNEFTILLTNCDLEHAKRVAKRIRMRITESGVRSGKKMIYIPCSCGVVTVEGASLSMRDIMKFSFEALEAAKAKGKNTIAVY